MEGGLGREDSTEKVLVSTANSEEEVEGNVEELAEEAPGDRT